MQIKINRNFIWSNIFVDQLAECGVKYACISPGSRSTPITYSISLNKKIKTYIHVDERSSGFFALGLAKKSNTPVLIVTTSGTATAELYPAIIEAYQNRVPLIICTADRPSYLRNSGANQTINQENIYKNHIRFFYDTGLPKINVASIKKLKQNTIDAFYIAAVNYRGPVHFNLPFDKPLEPDSYTDQIEDKILVETLPEEASKKSNNNKNISDKKTLNNLISFINNSEKGIITVGAGNYDQEFSKLLNDFSLKYSLPVFADATSGLRFNQDNFPNLIINYDTFLRSDKFISLYNPKYIIHFGRPLTSPRFERLIKNKSTKIFLVNRFRDFKFKQAINYDISSDEVKFLKDILNLKFEIDTNPIINEIKETDFSLDLLKNKILLETNRVNEVQVLTEVLSCVAPNSNIMIGNSVPIRDLDFLAPAIKKNITIHNNRGASGIDGIVSTAAGIATLVKTPTYLILGDLSFYYDLNGLLALKQLQIPLVIILLNNNGGSIFKFLPIAKHKKVLEKYFLAPTNLEFGKIVQAFGIDYKELKSIQELVNHLKVSAVRKQPAVFEIKTNSDYSLSLRKKYWKLAVNTIDINLRKYEV